ncbi:MAG: lactonase family protein [Bryobacteraceae bacterium]
MITRRGLITGALSSAAALAWQPRRPIFAYIGSYSSPQGPEGSHGNGQGIYLFQMNPETGALSPREAIPNPANPSWLAFDPTRTHLYSANETADGSASAYSIDRASGHLTLLNTVSSEGAGPAHLSVHPSGKYVFVANYAGGTVAVLPILAHGELGPATDVKHDQGPLGPAHASSAPPGSFAISGHDKVHAHMIQADPSGRFVLAADLALDRILIWKFDAARGTLSANDPPWVALPPGDGPRHFVFHPNGRWLYSLQEEASTLAAFDYDAARGSLAPKQTVSSLPKGFAGTNYTSEVRVSPDARFVYAANRLHDSIAWFSIGDGGGLTFAGEEWTRGDYPRSFTVDPTGSFLYSCNQRGDAVVCFRVNRKTGGLTFTGQYTPVGTPSIIVFLT